MFAVFDSNIMIEYLQHYRFFMFVLVPKLATVDIVKGAEPGTPINRQ